MKDMPFGKIAFREKNYMMYDELDYLNALTKINAIDYNEEKWLIDNFKLFKSTLNWPDGLPPINRTNLIEGTFRKKFNLFYSNLLNENSHDLKNKISFDL